MSVAVAARELRCQLSDVLGRTMYRRDRIGVIRTGKSDAGAAGVADPAELEMAQDVAAHRAAEVAEEERVPLAAVPDELAGRVAPSSSPRLRLGSCARSTARCESACSSPSRVWP